MLSYCDFIANTLKVELEKPNMSADEYSDDTVLFFNEDGNPLIRVMFDLHPTMGYLVSTRKVMNIKDQYGTRYRVTIENLDENPI